uniref:Uncharacterized protein n=1 Tax=Pipistrellus kuhlii TaxID=59472 RepID=A0A7J7RT34_PIPKU|nr:hypothetical protein mPipKuh1_010369 [Pipistrellus kuhlii]
METQSNGLASCPHARAAQSPGAAHKRPRDSLPPWVLPFQSLFVNPHLRFCPQVFGECEGGRERKGERKREGGRSINVRDTLTGCFPRVPGRRPGSSLKPRYMPLTGNWTQDPLVHRPTLCPLGHTGPAWVCPLRRHGCLVPCTAHQQSWAGPGRSCSVTHGAMALTATPAAHSASGRAVSCG